MQVAQLEKEKKDMNQRLRIIAKRVDHVERAYRKEERPLLAQDYDQQQLNDRETFEITQKTRRETSKLSHKEDLETKIRLSRMTGDYEVRREVYIQKRGDEFAKKREVAQKKMEEEKAKKRRDFILREEERKQQELEEEEERREEEERMERLERGSFFLSFFFCCSLVWG